MKKRVLIAGGTGYVGSRLALMLAESGFSVSINGRYDPRVAFPGWSARVEQLFLGDIRDPRVFADICRCSFDVIVNLISRDYQSSELDVEETAAVNTTPTWRLLEHFATRGCEKFIYLSSQKVLGPLPAGRVDESFLPRPADNFALSHFLSEQIVDAYSTNQVVQGINVRLSNAYGYPLFAHGFGWRYVLNDLCRLAVSDRKIQLKSDGSPLRDFIHVSDVCRALVTLVEADVSGGPYHLASSRTISLLEAAYMVKAVYRDRYGEDVPVVLGNGAIAEPPLSADESCRYTLDTRRLMAHGFKPEITLWQGIDDFFACMENPGFALQQMSIEAQ